jgi:hypothetical protein
VKFVRDAEEIEEKTEEKSTAPKILSKAERIK